MYNDISGIILAGGKSTRMGKNKAFMTFDGDTFISRTATMMSSLFERVLLVTNTPSDYSSLGLEMCCDIYSYGGPLAGIHAGLTNSNTDKNFVISCDIPLVTSCIIQFICNYESTNSIVLPRADGFVQHLCGCYSKQISHTISELLESKKDDTKKCSIHDLLNIVQPEIIDSADIPGYEEGTFLNLNSPDDYKLLLSKSAHSAKD